MENQFDKARALENAIEYLIEAKESYQESVDYNIYKKSAQWLIDRFKEHVEKLDEAIYFLKTLKEEQA